MSKENDPTILMETVEEIGRRVAGTLRPVGPFDPHPWDGRGLDPGPGGVIMIGDLDSNEKGSGARMNADKLAVELIPVRCWRKLFGHQVSRMAGGCQGHLHTLLDLVEVLADFQEGKASGSRLIRAVPSIWFDDAIDVFVYGGRKYKMWNWLKGQPWSVPTASAIRHARAVFDGEIMDRESGLVHTGHFMCNLIMLSTFYDTYPEGNDFPDPKFFREQ